MTLSDLVRFYEKVNTSPGLGPNGDCHEWTGCLTHNGYGQFRLDGSAKYAHRVWFIHNRHEPDGDVCHTCDNRKCVRLEHLFSGTRKENMADCVSKARQVRGERNGMSILTEVEATDILLSTESGAAVARRYGISPNTVYDIRNGRRWKHIRK